MRSVLVEGYRRSLAIDFAIGGSQGAVFCADLYTFQFGHAALDY